MKVAVTVEVSGISMMLARRPNPVQRSRDRIPRKSIQSIRIRHRCRISTSREITTTQARSRDDEDRPAVSPFQPPPGRLHALLNASAASESTTAGSLKAPSSNASAASESTTAGGLEAFSQSSAGTERFENASSKFRWNPSPLLPFT